MPYIYISIYQLVAGFLHSSCSINFLLITHLASPAALAASRDAMVLPALRGRELKALGKQKRNRVYSPGTDSGN